MVQLFFTSSFLADGGKRFGLSRTHFTCICVRR